MKKISGFVIAVMVCISICCSFSYATQSTCLFKVWLEPIGKHKIVSFDEGCSITIHYTWSGTNNGITEGVFSIVSDEVEIEKSEMTDEEFWSEEYEPYSEHEMNFYLGSDMLKKDSGKILFSITSYEDSFMESTGVTLYFVKKGDKICLSEYEGTAETYLARKPVICWLSAISVIILLYIAVRFARGKYKTHMERKNIAALMMEREAEENQRKQM